MATDNYSTIVGNLVDDPELRYTSSGTAVANLRVAVTPRLQQDGEWCDGYTSLKVNVWRGQAEHRSASGWLPHYAVSCGAQGPATCIASSWPGHGGIVTPTAASGSRPVLQNWNAVPTGIVSAMPGRRSISRSVPSWRRHIRPSPWTMYHTSLTVRC